MRREISPELYNYNKFPGPQFICFDDQVKADDLHFKILENHKDAFDASVFSQRFSEILIKYDYIVGDWGNEQLRLKGFYKDDREGKKSDRISRLDDYIKEYCNFGCAYFLLENPDPREVAFEEERLPRKRKSKKQGPKVNGQRQSKFDTFEGKKAKQKHFKSKKRQDKSQDFGKPARSKKKQQLKNNSQQHFVIRKKDN